MMAYDACYAPVRMDSAARCLTPDEVVNRYLQGSSIKNLTKDVFRSKLFVNKTYARTYVEKSIYDYHMIQKKTGFNN